MKTAILAIDPLTCNEKSFDNFSKGVRWLQQSGVINKVHIASIFTPWMASVPLEFYRKQKDQIGDKARVDVSRACRGRVSYESVEVIFSNSPAKEDHIADLTEYGESKKADVVIIGSNDRKGAPGWFLGSFATTAALVAKMPLLILKPGTEKESYSKKPRYVVTIDVMAPPKHSFIKRMAYFARVTQATIDLLYVSPKDRGLLNSLQMKANFKEASGLLKKIEKQFAIEGINVTAHVVKAKGSTAEEVVKFADSKKAWMIVSVTVPREQLRKLLLGSTAREVLSLTRRPFLSLRQA